MKLIVDTNIIFSALLTPKSSIADILLNSRESLEFVSCYFLKEEIEKHKSKITRRTDYTDEEFRYMVSQIIEPVTFISEELIPFDVWKEAARLVRDIDMNDIAFVALSIFIKEKIWTGDKKLSQGLQKMGYSRLISTPEILAIRSKF